MKVILLVILAVFTLPSIAQKPQKDSVKIFGTTLLDTMQVRVIMYDSSGLLHWRNGYQVRTSFWYSAEAYIPGEVRLTDEKFQPFKKEDEVRIFDARQYKWKK